MEQGIADPVPARHGSPSAPRGGAPLADGVLTFVLTDIEGSVSRWEATPTAMREAVRQHDDILWRELSGLGAHVFRTAGDSFHAAFAVPSAGMAAAVAALRALMKEDFSGVGGLPVRIAVHAGPVESRDGDYFGRGINQAARLLSITAGNQILVTGATARMVANELGGATSLRDLGSHFLRDSTDPERIYQVVAPDLPGEFPPIKSAGKPPNNLTSGTNSFVGRDRELAEIERALTKARLLTLIGNGGAGKTRLASEAAEQLAPRFPDGLWFIDFSGIDDPALAADKAATVVGARASTDQSGAASVVAALMDRTALLIFDNCEHVIDAAANLAEQVLRRCGQVAIIATSRQPLAVPAEHLIHVGNLAVPGGFVTDSTIALESPAIRLLADRASAISAFQLTDDNATAVVDICRQLDGIPLAIELAAPQLRLVKPTRLAELLRASLPLQSPLRTTPGRHRTLTATLDWSYRLLREEERLLLLRLSVFASGWTIETATAVCGWGPVRPDLVQDLLRDLCDKSLVVADLAPAEPRFRLLETTRHYALKRLANEGEADAARQRLARCMLDVLTEANEQWPRAPTEAWVERYGPELDNVRAALDWAFAAPGDPATAVRIVSCSLRLWDENGLFPERQRWFDRALSAAPDDLPFDVRARLHLGKTSLSAAADPSGFGVAEKAIRLMRACPPSLDLGEALSKAGAAILTPTTIKDAWPYLSEAYEVLKPFGATKQLASCLRSLCAMRFFESDLGGARGFAMEAESVSRKIGDSLGLITNRINLAEIDFADGDIPSAIATSREVLRSGKGGPRVLAVCQANLASYLLRTNDIDGAREAAVKALGRARALSWQAETLRALGHLALIASLGGDGESAAQLLGYVEGTTGDVLATKEPIERPLHERLVSDLGKRLPPEKLALLRRVGASCSEEEAAELALRSAGEMSLFDVGRKGHEPVRRP